MSTPHPSSARYTSTDVALLALLGVAWGLAYVFIREGIVDGAAPLLFAAVRYALSAVAFALIAVVRREAFPRRRELAVSATFGGIILIGMYGGFLYWGEQYTAGGYASVLSTIVPILTLVLATGLLPRERLGFGSLVGIGVGFAGTVVLVAPALAGGPGGGWEGTTAVIAAFVCGASGSVLLRRWSRGPQGLWQIGAQFAVGAALLSAGTVVLGAPDRLPGTEVVGGALVALVLLSSVVGYFTYFTLHHRIGPVRANVVTYLLPLVGVGVGTGFFGEPVTAWEIGGCLIVLAGMTLIVRESLRRSGPAGPADAGQTRSSRPG